MGYPIVTQSLSLFPSSIIDEDKEAPGRPQSRIARADVVGHRTDGRVLKQRAPTEIVSVLAFLPPSTHLPLTGISARWLRLFNLRIPTPRCIHLSPGMF
ncbi:hypothetical protein K503DRAFT_777699 [Rhizopogon vinicolor AM-OR11-026]|uniref:Uncharacterized protein n=1 Tax=Rhizopogon vinicolor AM-OR11-026 TaxID=1314800 RepID=A0A1B7MFE9_9AGAM|nr:hypothetical protein K503DRAFT_777699 [Rhizopogon vinicolor AM-OR11-026]